jgi:hypothetical protein
MFKSILIALVLGAFPAAAHDITFSLPQHKEHHIQIKVPEGWEQTGEKAYDRTEDWFSSPYRSHKLFFKQIGSERTCTLNCHPNDNAEALEEVSEFNKHYLQKSNFHIHNQSFPISQWWQTFQVRYEDRDYSIGVNLMRLQDFVFVIIVQDEQGTPSLRPDADAFAEAIKVAPN